MIIAIWHENNWASSPDIDNIISSHTSIKLRCCFPLLFTNNTPGPSSNEIDLEYFSEKHFTNILVIHLRTSPVNYNLVYLFLLS